MGEFTLLTVGLIDDFCLTQQQWTMKLQFLWHWWPII